MNSKEEPFPIPHLSIVSVAYDLDEGSSFISLDFNGAKASIWVDKNEDPEAIRKKITTKFRLRDDQFVAAIYTERYGPIYPFDVISRLPKAFNTNTFHLYVIPMSPRLESIISGARPTDPPKFDLDSLLLPFGAAKKKAAKELTEIIRYYGYIRFDLPDRYWAVYSKAKPFVEKFFSLPKDTKERYHSDGSRPGYYVGTSNREVYHIHKYLFHPSNPMDHVLPTDIPEFKDIAYELYEAFKEILVAIFIAIGTTLGFPTAYLHSLVEEGDDCDFNYSTTMRLFRYNPVSADAAWIDKLQCFEHADTTLLTLSPCSSVPEVEMVDRGSGYWKITEQGATEREALLFPGVYLAYLTGGYIAATLHRVKRSFMEKHRISTPMFLRSPKDAVFNRKKMDPEIMKHVARNKMTLKQFLNHQDEVLPHLAHQLPAPPADWNKKEEDEEHSDLESAKDN